MDYKIETERLILAPFEDADIDRRVELANDIDVARIMLGHPFHRILAGIGMRWNG